MNENTPSQAELDEFLGVRQEEPWRKWVIRGAFLLALIGAVYLLARTFMGGDEPQYATAEVVRGSLTVTVSATGNLQPTNQVEVGSEQSGLVTDVYVQNNDRVTRGQVLARLDTARLQDTVIQGRAGLASSEASVGQAQATLAQANANLARLEEVSRLSGGKVPSKVEMDSARAEQRRAVASLRASQAQVMQARAQLSSAQTNLSKASIYSPVTGVVLSRQVEPGQTVAASLNAPVLFIIAEDLSQMQLEVKVDEADVGQVKDGQRASFTVDAYPGRTFPARIERVDVGANASGSSSSGSSSAAASSSTVVAYTAVLSVANPELILRPGMTATADIVTTESNNVLLVPNAALRFSPDRAAAGAGQQQGGVTSALITRPSRRGNRAEREVAIGRGSRQTVHVLGEDGKPTPVQVTVGETNGSQTEVSSKDLKPGMRVVTGQFAGAEGTAGSGTRGRGSGQGRQQRGE